MIEKGLFGIRSRLYRDFERISNEIVNYLVDMEGIDTNGAKHKLACRYVVYKILKIGKTTRSIIKSLVTYAKPTVVWTYCIVT